MSGHPSHCDCGRRLQVTTLGDGETGWGCPACGMVWTWSTNDMGSHWWIWT